MVLDVLSGASGPLSAYTILDQLRDDGFRAPLQVYRALEKLIELGKVHRLESLNAFVACRHTDCSTHEAIIFMICEGCNTVSELTNEALALTDLARNHKFRLRKSTVELFGTCAMCQAT